MNTLACPGKFKDYRGRVLHPLALATEALAGTQICPQSAGMRCVLTSIAQLHGRIVAVHPWCRQCVRNQRGTQHLQQLGTGEFPLAQGRARQINAMTAKDDGLSVDRHVVCVGGHQNLGQ